MVVTRASDRRFQVTVMVDTVASLAIILGMVLDTGRVMVLATVLIDRLWEFLAGCLAILQGIPLDTVRFTDQVPLETILFREILVLGTLGAAMAQAVSLEVARMAIRLATLAASDLGSRFTLVDNRDDFLSSKHCFKKAE